MEKKCQVGTHIGVLKADILQVMGVVKERSVIIGGLMRWRGKPLHPKVEVLGLFKAFLHNLGLYHLLHVDVSGVSPL